ncbi:MAG: gliding motility-associated C-terminal domain-containing protein [Bacteroidia bacterium]|nr:gliding motility-associated C-terminal domain-containing protein [Bacteroidia bacterium]
MNTFLKNCFFIILLTYLVLLVKPSHSQTLLTYSVPGATSWTVPSCVTSITVQTFGAGGGGGGAIAIVRNSSDGEACSGAGGGGGGGYSSAVLTVTPGQVYSIVVGAGGTAGISGSGTWSGGISTPAGPGGTGGTSSFSGYSYNVQATGGTGGLGSSAYNNNNPPDMNATGLGGTGGVGSGGSVNFNGGNGAAGYILFVSTDKSGAGGGAAGPGGNGGNGTPGNMVGIVNPPGGIGQAPGGNGGDGRMNNIPSNFNPPAFNGNTFGGGAGGALVHKEGYNVLSRAGGVGANGAVRIFYNIPSSPGITSVTSTTINCNFSTAQAAITYTNGATTFTWSGPGIVSGQGTGTINVNVGGAYSYSASAGGGCVTTGSINVTSNIAYPDISSNAGSLSCSVLTTTVTASTPASPVSYTWTGPGVVSGSGSATANVNQPGTYSYTVTNTSNGCKSTGTVAVTQNTSVVTASVASTNSINCNTTSAQVIASTTVTPVSYNWSGSGIVSGGGTPTITVNQGGTFNYTITNTSNGCVTTGNINIPSSTNAPVVGSSNGGNLNCNILTTTASATTVTSPVTYNWSGPGIVGSNTVSTISINQPGTYNYTVTNPANGCITTGAQVISQNTTPPATTASLTTIITCTTTSGTLQGGPLSGVTYTWTGAGISSNPNLAAVTITNTGTYTLTTTSTVNGCTNTAVVTVTANLTPPQVSINPDVTINCAVPSATLQGSSSTPGATFSWNPGGSSPTTATTVVNSPGTYTLTVTNPANGCTSSAVQSVVQNTTAPTLTVNSTQTINCISTNAVLSSTTSSSPVSYSWIGPGIGNPAGSTPTNSATTVNVGGTYTLVITNTVNSCYTASVVSVIQNTTTPLVTPSVSGIISCTAAVVTASANTLASPVTYAWNGPGIISATNTSTISANQAGVYAYTVTNTSNGCFTTGTVAISQNTTTPTLTVSNTQTITCSTPTVSITGSASPSTVTPVWTGGVCAGANSFTASACSPGIYTLTVTDPINGCVTSKTVEVVPSTGVPAVTASSTGTITCTNTTAQVAATTTATPVTYAWSGPGTVTGATSSTGTVSVGGTYQCVVTNTLTGCSATITTVVPSNTTPVVASASSSGSITCSTQTLNLSATPSGTTYGYSWSGPGTIQNNTTSTPTVDNGGVYTVTITNSTNGCVGNATVSVASNTIAPTLTLSPASLTTTCANPTVAINASSNAGTNATYSWTVPATGSLSNPNINNPIAGGSGVFTVQVTNTVSGCTSATATMTLTADANTPTITAVADNTVICEGSVSTLTVSGADTYTWSTSQTVGTITVSPTSNTTYSVIGTNTTTGCSGIANITVSVTPSPTVNINASSLAICDGASTTFTLTGATNYTVSAPNQTTTNTVVVSPTVQTTYTVTGETQNCTSNTTTITVDVNPLPLVTVSDATTCAGSPVTLTSNNADVYNWTPTGETTNTISVNPTSSTSYSVTGTNTLTGCTSTIVVANVTVNDLPTITASSNPSITCITETVTLNATTSGTTSITSYTWTLGNGITSLNQNTSNPSFPASGLSTGTYTYVVTATDANGCVSPVASTTVEIIDAPNANFDLSDLSICQNANGSISVNTPQSGITYDWEINGQNFTNTNPLIIPSSVSGTTGTYTVSVIASLGTCTNTASNTLTISALPTIALVNYTVSACENASAGLEIANPTSGNIYTWAYNSTAVGTGTTYNINALSSSNIGTYTASVVDANGCANSTVGLIDMMPCETYIPEIFTPNGDGKNDGFVIKNIENYPNNKLKIFNRWGNLVYQKDGYLNEFDGFANTGDQVGKNKLPAGTYYVILEYGDDKTETYNGYLILQY